MGINFRQCTPADAPSAVALIDRVFLATRGRKGTVADRYPHVFGRGSGSTLFIASDSDHVVGCVVLRPFHLLAGANNVRGGMIGFVCTDEGRRGEGIASTLLSRTADEMLEQGFDFGVLWTTIHPYYEAIGWRAQDEGQVGTYTCERIQGRFPPSVECVPAATVDAAELEELRARWCDRRLVRDERAYRVVPAAVENVLCLRCGRRGDGSSGFALVGTADDRAYVYDVVGSPDVYADLWSAIKTLRPRLLINSNPFDPFFKHLAGVDGIEWSKQDQAMWLDFRGAQGVGNFFLPYFDRI